MSRIADEIVREYKIKEAYKKRNRQQCKEMECRDCIYFNVCTDKTEEGKRIEKNNFIP